MPRSMFLMTLTIARQAAAFLCLLALWAVPAAAQRGESLDRALRDLANGISDSLVQIDDRLTEPTRFYVVTARAADGLYCDPMSEELTGALNQSLGDEIRNLDRENILFGFVQSAEDLGAISLEWTVTSSETLRLRARLGDLGRMSVTSATADVAIDTIPEAFRVCLDFDARVTAFCTARSDIRLRTSPLGRGGDRAGRIVADQEFEVLGAYDLREDGDAGALLLAWQDISDEGSSRMDERMAFARGGIDKLREWEEDGTCEDVDYGGRRTAVLTPQCSPWEPDYPAPNRCENCPEMIVLPAQGFALGRTTGSRLDASRLLGATDQAAVDNLLLAVGQKEITLGEFGKCVAAGACQDISLSGANRNRGESHPVSVSWAQAQQYINWLNSISQCKEYTYRLPREAEWEYAARGALGLEAGRPAPAAYFWGDVMQPGRAVCKGCGGNSQLGDGPLPASIADQRRRSGWRLFDMSGNLWEWTADCWTERMTRSTLCASGKRVVKGGSYADGPLSLRVENRAGAPESLPHPAIGFRVVATEPAPR
ncbi:MAG: formylglycine-generating enzyme family protein [Pikeienuella sp.]